MIDNMFVISPVSIVLSGTKRNVLVTRYVHYIIIYNITYYFIQHVDHEISEFPTVDRQHNLVVRLDHV